MPESYKHYTHNTTPRKDIQHSKHLSRNYNRFILVIYIHNRNSLAAIHPIRRGTIPPRLNGLSTTLQYHTAMREKDTKSCQMQTFNPN